jgi:hypothetical protein
MWAFRICYCLVLPKVASPSQLYSPHLHALFSVDVLDGVRPTMLRVAPAIIQHAAAIECAVSALAPWTCVLSRKRVPSPAVETQSAHHDGGEADVECVFIVPPLALLETQLAHHHRYIGVTVVLQSSIRATVVLQWCHSGVTVITCTSANALLYQPHPPLLSPRVHTVTCFLMHLVIKKSKTYMCPVEIS